jgi:hypothetical protein
MWKRLVMLGVFGLLASCGQQEVSSQDPQKTQNSYKNGTDVSKIIKLDDFFNGNSDLYNKLEKSNDTKSNIIAVNGVGNFTLYKQSHYDGNNRYTSIIVPVGGTWNGLVLNQIEWSKSSDNMWGYFSLYFRENPTNLSKKINKLMADGKINICYNEYLKEPDTDCYCTNYKKDECGKKLYPKMPVNLPLVEIIIQPDLNSEEGSILSYGWSS